MYICDKCDRTFEQTPKGKQDWLLHRANHNQEVDPGLGKIPPKSMSATEIRVMKEAEAKTRKPKTPKLTYRWEGECPDCLGMLDSITIDAGQPKGKTIAVAFCSTCHKEVAYRPVEKL
jgi:hypothetical protein